MTFNVTWSHNGPENYIRKFGRIVELNLYTLKNNAIAERDMIASIPAGFRPKYAVNACMLEVGATYGNGIAIVNIQTDETTTLNFIVDHKNEGAWRWVIGKVLYIAD